MNLPNKITIGRLMAIPLILVLLLLYNHTGRGGYYISALIIYFFSIVSDGVDGYLARSRNLQTRLGTLLDPLADKLLLDSMIVLLACGIRGMFRIPVWLVIIVLCRDGILFTIAICLYKHWTQGNMKIKPNWWGKTSAVFLMVTVILSLLQPCYQPLKSLIEISVYITALLTIISGITYLSATFKGLHFLKSQ